MQVSAYPSAEPGQEETARAVSESGGRGTRYASSATPDLRLFGGQRLVDLSLEGVEGLRTL